MSTRLRNLSQQFDFGKLYIPEDIVTMSSPCTPHSNGRELTEVLPPLGTHWSGRLFVGSANAVRLNPHIVGESVILRFVSSNDVICRNLIECILPDNSNGSAAMETCIRQHAQPVLDMLHNGETVIVHCQEGISRSVTFVAALLQLHAFNCNYLFDASRYGNAYIASLRLLPNGHHVNATDINFGFAGILYKLFNDYRTLNPNTQVSELYPCHF